MPNKKHKGGELVLINPPVRVHVLNQMLSISIGMANMKTVEALLTPDAAFAFAHELLRLAKEIEE